LSPKVYMIQELARALVRLYNSYEWWQGWGKARPAYAQSDTTMFSNFACFKRRLTATTPVGVETAPIAKVGRGDCLSSHTTT